MIDTIYSIDNAFSESYLIKGKRLPIKKRIREVSIIYDILQTRGLTIKKVYFLKVYLLAILLSSSVNDAIAFDLSDPRSNASGSISLFFNWRNHFSRICF